MKKITTRNLLLVLFALLALSLSACISLAEDITPPPDAQSSAPLATEEPAANAAPAEDIDAESLFLEYCAVCHGKDGKGVSVNVDLTDGGRMNRFPDAMLYALIAEGNESGMPAFSGEMSEAEMDALVAYLREISSSAAESTANAEAGTKPDAESAAEGEKQTKAASDATDGVGSISGTVTNGTGGDLPTGLIVELQAYDHNMATGEFNKAFTRETTLNDDGTYLFDEVEMPEGRAFLAVVKNNGVSYQSEPDFITGGINELEMPITYYETSKDVSQISVDRLHIFFDIPNTEAQSIQMVEVFIISNPTLYAVIPEAEGKAVIEFTLPEGASNIQFEDSVFGERYTERAGGFGDTAAILPGMSQHQVVVFFEMPYKRKMNFVQEINHSIGAATVMVPQGMKIKSDYLTPNGEREAQGLTYDIYASQPLPVGATFEMRVSGTVSSSAAGGNTDSTQKNIIYGALALGVVLIGAGVWFYLRGSDDEYEDEAWEEGEPLFEDAESIMDAIIALDDAYRSGDLEEAVYKKRRAKLKAQLKDLVD